MTRRTHYDVVTGKLFNVGDDGSLTEIKAEPPTDAGYRSDDTTVTIHAPTVEQADLLRAFTDMLAVVSRDGGLKRARGEKPPWWCDPSHEPAIFSHLSNWKHGGVRDKDSGAHPLVHLAWRALAIAYQETAGRVDPARPAMHIGVCSLCGDPLSNVFYGAGDGRGQKFACSACYAKGL